MGAVAETVLMPSSMGAALISKAPSLMGTIEKLSVDLMAMNPSFADCVRLPDGLLIQTLTPRERQVLSWMAHGSSNSAIAERLILSRKTVENYINRIYQSLQLDHEDDVSARVLAVLDYIDYISGSPANNSKLLDGEHERVANS